MNLQEQLDRIAQPGSGSRGASRHKWRLDATSFVAAQQSRLGARVTARKSPTGSAGLGIALDADLRTGASLALALKSDFSN